MKIFIGADHNGWQHKEALEKHLKKIGFQVVDEGNDSLNPEDDFPVFAAKVVHDMIKEGPDSRGILLCGSGQGMAIAANRFKGIRAVVTDSEEDAKLSRNDDDTNVLAIPSYTLKDKQAMYNLVESWLATPFEHIPRRVRRLKQLDELN